jgi:beta-glucanase (GH16 family)
LTAIWLLPRSNFYGAWPTSGEIDLTESRGNKQLFESGQNIGSELSSSTLHFGPFWPLNGYENAHFEKNTAPNNGFDTGFNRFQLEWTPGIDGLTCKNKADSRAIQCMCYKEVHKSIRDHQI